MKNVYITIGLPSSGKSTWMEEHLKDKCHGSRDRWTVLDADMICKEQNGSEDDRTNFKWIAQVHYQRFNLLLRRDDYNQIGITNTSLSVYKRQQYWLLAKRANIDVKFVLVYFDVSAEECIRRQGGRERKVPHDVIRRMEKEIVFPTPEELKNFGCNTEIIYVK